MTGSMYAAVSGLKAHMSALNVIGNNVSNVNTLGYKTTRYTFNEALYATQRSGSDGTTLSGGRNPAQVGFGASIGTIDLDMSTKNYSPTGKQLDTMIDGDGFFMVADKVLGSGRDTLEINGNDDEYLKGMNLTRLGNFEIDSKGYMVDGNGSVVWGFMEREATGDDLPMASAAAGGSATRYEFYDASASGSTPVAESSLANKYLTKADTEEMIKNGTSLHNFKFKTIQVTTDGGATKDVEVVVGATVTDKNIIAPIRMPMNKKEVSTDSDGNETVVNNVQWPTYDPAHWEKPGEANAYAQPSDLTGWVEVPGSLKDNAAGTARLEHNSASINEKSGALTIMTSDGQLLTIGYLAIGKVTNPNGVTHVDGRYYQAQDGAGNLRVTAIKGGVSGVESAGDTKLITGGLESSGTDLATEITNMITVQRGYQANTRIVTVTDSMLEELVNMKR